MKLLKLDLLYASGDLNLPAESIVMCVRRVVANNDGREILEVDAPDLRQLLGYDRFLVTDISRNTPVSSHVRRGVVPVYLLSCDLQSDGSVDVQNLKPRVLDRGTVSLKGNSY